jgi:hypothetical protein
MVPLYAARIEDVRAAGRVPRALVRLLWVWTAKAGGWRALGKISEVIDVNDHGYVVGWFNPDGIDGHWRGFAGRVDPDDVPEPSTAILFGAALGLLRMGRLLSRRNRDVLNCSTGPTDARAVLSNSQAAGTVAV